MSRVATLVKICAVVSLAASGVAGAQQAPSLWEFGVDGRLTHTFKSPTLTDFTVPIGQLRVGYFISPSLSLEPYGRFSYSESNGAHGTTIGLGLGVLYNFVQNRALMQPYVRPFVEHTYFSSGNGSSSSSGGATLYGAGLGVKIPATDRISLRLEGALAGGEKSGTRGMLNFGVSVFTP